MLVRENPDESAEKEQKPAQFSIAALRNRFQADSSGQRSEQARKTQEELANLRGATRKRPPPPAFRPAPVMNTENTEDKRNRVAMLRDRLFPGESRPVPAPSAQKQAVEADLNGLRALEGNVRSKAQELEKLQHKSNQVLAVLKINKVSEAAKVKFTEFCDFQNFENQQTMFINAIREKVEDDIKCYTDSEHLQKIKFDRFLALSFYYRAYEVCLEKDFYRHAAASINKAGAFIDANSKAIIEALSAEPAELAVQSLNYYQDFFKNVDSIEQIWIGAGCKIRRLELRASFADCIYAMPTILCGLMEERDSDAYDLCNEMVEEAFNDYISNDVSLYHYIAHGDGLDMLNHPWTSIGCHRLPQPNASIIFNDIIAQDEEVAARVSDDVAENSQIRDAPPMEDDVHVRLRFSTVVNTLMALGMTK